jgi:hypothetical protein
MEEMHVSALRLVYILYTNTMLVYQNARLKIKTSFETVSGYKNTDYDGLVMRIDNIETKLLYCYQILNQLTVFPTKFLMYV